MIRSMTGYGRHQETVDGMSITVEIKSVNHRYFEYSSRLPRAYGFLDDKLKHFLQGSISRGKVDVMVWIDAVDLPGSQVVINQGLADAYVQALRQLSERYQIPDNLTAYTLGQFPEVLAVHKAPEDEERIWAAVKAVAEVALTRFIAMREQEGAHMREDILSRKQALLRWVDYIDERWPQAVAEYMEKMKARLRELLDGAAIDEQRLLTEAAIYADRLAVAEETVRLRSHLEQLEQLLNGNEAVGRKLDFLVQEINRETNTIGSKSQDLPLARAVVEMKADIEKIREQVQNIE